MNILLVIVAYLIGALPFGYLIGRWRGVDLFQVGSGNIGATNVWRVLGWKYGLLAFVLDFSKGVLPLAVMRPLFDPDPLWIVLIALATFIGHLCSVFLAFRGGKGVATGAGVIAILSPLPTIMGLTLFLAVVSSSLVVSLASIVTTWAIFAIHLLLTDAPWTGDAWPATLFLAIGSLIVTVKHRANFKRIWQGNENHLEDRSMLRTMSRALHLLGLASWFGSALFFNFLAAPVIFRTFKEVVQTAPNDRTANLPLLVNGSETEQAKLASGLAGAAVGPLFPIYFGLQSICVAVAFFTAFGWWYRGTGRPVERGRLVVLGMAGIATAISVPVSQYVTQLRTERLSLDPALAEAAVAAFGTWHLVSLALSFITTGLALVAIIYAARMPDAPAGTP